MKKTLSKQVQDHIAGLDCTQGDGAGSKFRLFPWQKRFLSGAFADGVDESGLCIARGNGKSTFCAAIAHGGA